MKLPNFLKVVVGFIAEWLMREFREALEEGIRFTGKPIPNGYELFVQLRKKGNRKANQGIHCKL